MTPTVLASPDESPTHRALILQSFSRRFEPHAELTAVLQTELAKRLARPAEFHDISLVSVLEGGTKTESAALDYLQALNDERGFDLVIAVGAPAARFVQRHRGALFRGSPLLVAGTDRTHLATRGLDRNDAAVLANIDFDAIFRNILTVFPDTTRVEVVLGASSLERFWRNEIEIASSAIADRTAVVLLDGLPFESVLERAASSPRHTAILFTMLMTDAAAIPHRDGDSLATLRSVSSAPVFGIFDFQLGHGIVGGPLIPVRELGADSARVAARLLAGEDPESLRPPPVGPTSPVFDAREIARFRVDPSTLPAGSTIRFRSPSLWESHRWAILGIAAAVLAQAMLILRLVLLHGRSRRTEDEVRRLTGRLVTAQEEERRRLARELHDDVSQRLARLAIDVGRIERETPDGTQVEALRQVEAGLATVSEDIHVLSYRLHPSLLEDLGLVEALEVECERFSDRAGIAAGLAVCALPVDIPKDAALCLFRVAQEALRNVERHADARRVDLDLEGRDGGIALSIRDDGVGIDPGKERAKTGIGLASMRERVCSFAGAFEVESAAGRGTTVRAFVPVVGVRS